MNAYPKIPNLYKRNIDTHKINIGEYSDPALAALESIPWHVTEKVDGTNVRVMWNSNRTEDAPYTLEFKGRTDAADPLHVDLVSRLNYLFDAGQFAKEFGGLPVCFYGEGFGPGIQKGGKYLPHKEFILFDVKVGREWLSQEHVTRYADIFGIRRTEVLSTTVTLPEAVSFLLGVYKSPGMHFGPACRITRHDRPYEMEGIILRRSMFSGVVAPYVLKLKTLDVLNARSE